MWTCPFSKSLGMSTTLSTTLASSNRNLVSWPNESLTADRIHNHRKLRSHQQPAVDGKVFMAWSLPPDNAYYVFARALDDTLRALEAKEDWWNDDILLLNSY